MIRPTAIALATALTVAGAVAQTPAIRVVDGDTVDVGRVLYGGA